MKKIIISLLFMILLSGSVLAADVAYIIVDEVKINDVYIEIMDEASVSYEIILSSDVSSVNFDDYEMILINDENFVNVEEIPINEYAALVVNGRNLKEWGWVKYISTAGNSEPFFIDIKNWEYDVTEGLTDNFQVYTSEEPVLYYIGEDYLYEGIQTIASVDSLPSNTVIGLIEAGTTLTDDGVPKTEVNANSIFFGITETNYWTDETKQLFKNSILWLLSGKISSKINLKQGDNLVSFQLILESNYIGDIFSDNPEIISIKEYNNGWVDVNTIEEGKAYFMKSSADGILSFSGTDAEGDQIVNLVNGLNLISVYTEIDLDDLPDGIIEVAKRNDDGSYSIATRYPFGWFNEFALAPGEGYWVKINKEVTWTYTV